MFEIITYASNIKSSSTLCWSIQYVSVWNQFFLFSSEGKAHKIINHKLRRLLYEEILQLDKFPNYRSSKILGLCLNVMGLELTSQNKRKSDFALHKIIIKWTKNNYLKLRKNNLEVSESCLLGSVAFDEQKKCLVKTFEKGLNKEPYRSYGQAPIFSTTH